MIYNFTTKLKLHHALIKVNSQKSKIISIPHDQKERVTLLQRFPMDSFSADVNVYMCALSYEIALKVNDRLFTHSDVSCFL